jgi:hypothetical protein
MDLDPTIYSWVGYFAFNESPFYSLKKEKHEGKIKPTAPLSRQIWRYLKFMSLKTGQWLPSLLFASLMGLFATVSAQNINNSSGRFDGSPSGDPVREGFRVVLNGHCQNGEGQAIKDAVISLWVPADSALIGQLLTILPNGNVSEESAVKFRAMKRKQEEGMPYYPNKGLTATDSSG